MSDINTLADVVRVNGAGLPDKIALVQAGRDSVTWAQLLRARGADRASPCRCGGGCRRPGGVPRQEQHRTLRRELRCGDVERSERRRQLAAGRTRGAVHRRRRRCHRADRRPRLRAGARCDRRSAAEGDEVRRHRRSSRPRGLRRVDGSISGRRPGRAGRRRRCGVPALLLGHHRPTQGGDAEQPQPVRAPADGQGHVGDRSAIR